MYVANLLTERVAKNDLERVLQAQTSIAIEHYGGVLSLASDDLGMPAEGVSRNLFELVIGTVYLAKNPALLQDFLDYGKFIRYRQVRASKTSSEFFKVRQQEEVKRSEKEYAALSTKFSKRSWHGKTIEKLTKDAGLVNLYDSYYRRASSVAHGDGFNVYHWTSQGWQIGVRRAAWLRAARTSMIFGYQLLVILFDVLNDEMNLELQHEIRVISELMKEMTAEDVRQNAPGSILVL